MAKRTKKSRKHNHYFKDVRHLKYIDTYRVNALFNVNDPAIAHATKKLLCAGGRGAKDEAQDYQEAIDSIQRKLDMMKEDARATKSKSD